MSKINELVALIFEEHTDSLQQKLREAITTEYDAIQYYQDMREMFKSDKKAYDTISSILDEEKIHVEELNLLLKKYDNFIPSAIRKAKKENS